MKEAAVELQLKVGQITHLINQNLINYKLENGTKFVDVKKLSGKTLNAFCKG